MSVAKQEYSVEPNRFLELLWYAVGLAALAMGLYASISGAAVLLPGMIGLAMLLFSVGAQRNSKWAVPSDKFRRRIIVLSLFVAIYCGAIASMVGKL